MSSSASAPVSERPSPLRERLLSNAYDQALECFKAGGGSRLDLEARFERNLKTLAGQPPEDAELAALALCSTAMDAKLLWPVRALMQAHCALPLNFKDRVFLIEAHLRSAPVEPRTRAREDVTHPTCDPTVLWSAMACALMEPPFEKCPVELAGKVEAVADHFLSKGTEWMAPSSLVRPSFGNKSTPSPAEESLEIFKRLKSLCETRQLEDSARRGVVKRGPRSV